jgi:hypothetical protein
MDLEEDGAAFPAPTMLGDGEDIIEEDVAFPAPAMLGDGGFEEEDGYLASTERQQQVKSSGMDEFDDGDIGAFSSPSRVETAVNGEEVEEMDDFDDFDEPAEAAPLSAVVEDGEDGFGDFGDFEEGDFEEAVDVVAPLQTRIQEPSWVCPDETFGGGYVLTLISPQHALNLTSRPSTSHLLDQLTTLLEPINAASSSSSVFTDEPPRSVSGLGQIMISESR